LCFKGSKVSAGVALLATDDEGVARGCFVAKRKSSSVVGHSGGKLNAS
jgi:hypothetical protein